MMYRKIFLMAFGISVLVVIVCSLLNVDEFLSGWFGATAWYATHSYPSKQSSKHKH